MFVGVLDMSLQPLFFDGSIDAGTKRSSRRVKGENTSDWRREAVGIEATARSSVLRPEDSGAVSCARRCSPRTAGSITGGGPSDFNDISPKHAGLSRQQWQATRSASPSYTCMHQARLPFYLQLFLYLSPLGSPATTPVSRLSEMHAKMLV